MSDNKSTLEKNDFLIMGLIVTLFTGGISGVICKIIELPEIFTVISYNIPLILFFTFIFLTIPPLYRVKIESNMSSNRIFCTLGIIIFGMWAAILLSQFNIFVLDYFKCSPDVIERNNRGFDIITKIFNGANDNSNNSNIRSKLFLFAFYIVFGIFQNYNLLEVITTASIAGYFTYKINQSIGKS